MAQEFERKTEIVLVNGNPVATVVNTPITAKVLKSKTFDILSEEIEVEDPATKVISKMQKGEVILRNLVHLAVRGNQDAISEILDRTMGRPVQQNVNLNGEMQYNELLDMLGIKNEDASHEFQDIENNTEKEDDIDDAVARFLKLNKDK